MEEITHYWLRELLDTAKVPVKVEHTNIYNWKSETNTYVQEWVVKFDKYAIASMSTDKLEKLVSLAQSELDNRNK